MTDVQQQSLVDVSAADPTPALARPVDLPIRYPTAREWEVTGWALPLYPATAVYRLFRDGACVPTAAAPDDTPMISVEHAAELVAAGTLVPCAVSALAPLIREVTRFRAVCELVEGPEACNLGECDHVGDDGEQLEPCPQNLVLATGTDLMRLNRVRGILVGYFTPDGRDAELEALRELRQAIRSAAFDDIY